MNIIIKKKVTLTTLLLTAFLLVACNNNNFETKTSYDVTNSKNTILNVENTMFKQTDSKYWFEVSAEDAIEDGKETEVLRLVTIENNMLRYSAPKWSVSAPLKGVTLGDIAKIKNKQNLYNDLLANVYTAEANNSELSPEFYPFKFHLLTDGSGNNTRAINLKVDRETNAEKDNYELELINPTMNIQIFETYFAGYYMPNGSDNRGFMLLSIVDNVNDSFIMDNVDSSKFEID